MKLSFGSALFICPSYVKQPNASTTGHNSCNFEIRRQTEMVRTKPIQYIVGE